MENKFPPPLLALHPQMARDMPEEASATAEDHSHVRPSAKRRVMDTPRLKLLPRLP